MPVNGYELHELDWDTQFFGIKMGQILFPKLLERVGFSQSAWLSTLESARRQNYRFLYCPFDVKQAEIAAGITGQGTMLGDILVTFGVDCTAKMAKSKSPYRVTAADPTDLPGILAIATHSFQDSRFFKDLHFDQAKVEGFYPSWLTESFAKGETIFVIKEAEQVLGFISLKPETVSQTMVIRLIAVHSSRQGEGLGQILIDHAITFTMEQQYHFLQVGTQLTNTAAINLYEKNGFRMMNAKYRYHIWLDEVFNVQYVKKEDAPAHKLQRRN